MFKDFQAAIQKQFSKMQTYKNLYRVSVDKDQLWKTYLSSFPAGSDPVYKERTSHDCNCCKNFIRAVGDVVAIVDGKIISIWDAEVGGYYQVVTDEMAAFIRRHEIVNQFLHPESKVGVEKNFQTTGEGEILTWYHFYLELPRKFYCKEDDLGTKLGKIRSTFDVMYRGLSELTLDAAETMLELIEQNSLPRGEEQKSALQGFIKLKKKFNKVPKSKQKLFCWEEFGVTPPEVAHIRNNVPGTLLIDLSAGKDLEDAVKAYEYKVAGNNYRRSKSLVTKSMSDAARKKLQELDLESATDRRHAKISDITINNVLFADNGVREQMSPFDKVVTATAKPVKNLDKVETVTIQNFIDNILPKAESLELMVDNHHFSNFFSLMAPVDPDAGNLFRWKNNFSWAYVGDVADSVKERVKRAGGNVDGYARFSLSWFNYDDLDLHVVEPGNYEIYYGNKRRLSPSHGMLDVDMNAGHGTSREAVENVCYASPLKMKEGRYKVYVRQFRQQEMIDFGFELEMEVGGVVQTFSYNQLVRGDVVVLIFDYSRRDGIKIVKSLESASAVKERWGIKSQQFHRVNLMMYSPNHWDGERTGNRHYFFVLDNCRNDEPARGFFNEFLREDLVPHRKTFEVLGSVMKAPVVDEQLSGLGFSSTLRNEVFCKVKGSFSRTIKITF